MDGLKLEQELQKKKNHLCLRQLWQNCRLKSVQSVSIFCSVLFECPSTLGKGPSPRSRSPGQPAVVVLRGVLCLLHKSTGTSEISDCIRNVHPATSISKQGTLHRVKGLNNKYTHRPTTPPLPVASNHRATAPPPDSQWDCVSLASPWRDAGCLSGHSYASDAIHHHTLLLCVCVCDCLCLWVCVSLCHPA